MKIIKSVLNVIEAMIIVAIPLAVSVILFKLCGETLAITLLAGFLIFLGCLTVKIKMKDVFKDIDEK